MKLPKNAFKEVINSLKDKLKESLVSVLPVSLIVLILSLTPWVNISGGELVVFGIATILLIIGIGLFNLGADMAMTPMGQYIGEGLTSSKKLGLLLSVAFIMGLLITIAEPDLSVLASQVSAVMNGTLLIVTVGVGVGIMLLLGVLKILFHQDLTGILMFLYMALFCLAALLMDNDENWPLLSMCFDSGGVTTGPITVPFIMALGVGIALTVGGRNANENSFGLIALCSVGPIAAVLLLSIFSTGSLDFKIPDYSMDNILSGGMNHLILDAMGDVAKSLIFIVLFFFILQFTVLHLPRTKISQIVFGIVYAFLGLVFFLTAVEMAFMPIGFKIGTELAGQPAIIIGLAFVIGMVVVLAEPAVHVLNNQVQDITGGEVSKRQMMIALSVGVGVSIGLSVIRVYYDFSLLYYLIPGYLISLGLSFFVPKLYTAIAFDSGGVASGPLTSSFILPLVIGACVTMQGESRVLDLAFGVVAMVAMTPLITIQCLGFKSVLSSRHRRNAAMRRILASPEEDPIIYFE
ncbi:MAG: DUF1538 domain-containing protein [Bacteroidales bacterium]|nr:DUF1538 domain-containing protein [Bacteroidales bacterium]